MKVVAVGIWGGQLVGVDWKGIDSGSFWSAMQASVELGHDIGNSVIKCLERRNLY